MASGKLIGVFIVATAAYTGTFIPGRVIVTTSPSLDHRVFYKRAIGSGDVPRKGDYVIARAKSRYINDGNPFDMAKRVACVPGEELRVEGRRYFCDGAYLGEARTRSLKGEPLKNFVFNGKVPAGNLFLMGDGKDSFDSRYLGFVKVDDVKAIVYPIL
ncbi:MAG: signal peptidase I [Candidatus Nitrospinota bacterium M3_3B_026]